MFTNIGKKIKGLAKFFCILGIIAGALAAIYMIINAVVMSVYTETLYPVLIYIPLALVGFAITFLLAWISTWGLYAFGELVDKTASIDRRLAMGNATVNVSNFDGFINTPAPPAPASFSEPDVNEIVSTPESNEPEAEPQNDTRTQIVDTVEEVETPDTEEKIPESKPQYKCPTCGSSVSQGDAFCGNCGQKFNW